MSFKTFQQFYSKLVKTLPMNDVIFIAELYSRDLFPDDVKEHVESLDTSPQKASYFLHHVIKPSVTSGVGRSFDKLLNVMEDGNYEGVSVRELAKLIRDSLGEETANYGRVAMSELYNHRPPLKDLYDHVVPSVADKWRDIGVHLLHPTLIDNRVLEVIAVDHPHSVEGCCKSMFEKWLGTQKDASWNQLIKSINTIGLCSVAKQLEKHLADVHYTTESNSEGSTPTVKLCSIDVSRLKVRYLNQPPTCKTDWPKHNVFHYVRLALVEKEDITSKDEYLNEITKLTLKGEVDKILKKKQPLHTLKDIFHYENQPCPRLILIMGSPGIGKTTIANEICIQWARGGFLADEFDVVILIPLRSVQERSLEDVMMEYVGEEDYPKLKKSAGSRCLLILEGLDEMAIDCQQNDNVLKRLIKKNTLLEKAKILITSRPHACEKLVVGRRVEVVGFGDKEIREFVEYSFPNDVESIEEFLRQLNEYPQLHSLCYIPLNLVMIIDIFRFSQKKLPSRVTVLYQLFIVMILQREVVKGSVKKLTVSDNVEVTLCKMLAGIPKEAVGIVYLLCKLAYHAFFKSYSDREEKGIYGDVKWWKDPKIIFTKSDLTECGIEVTSEFNVLGLLKATHVHQLPRDTVTYNFLHLTVQEFLCSLYMSTLSQQEQLNSLTNQFKDYPNVMMFLCGLTGLASNEMFKFVCSKFSSSKAGLFSCDPYVVTAIRSVYESNHSDPSHLISPFTLDMSNNTLSPYDSLCVSWLLSCYPVSQLEMRCCLIEDTGAKLLVRHYPGQQLEVLNLWNNDLTIAGLEDVMKIVRTSSTTLRVLNVGGNKIGDDGISMISEELKHNNSLTELSVRGCGLSVKGVTAVSKLLDGNCTLQVLNVAFNKIGDDGISVIIEQLQHITTLTELNVGWCGLSVKGATVISKLLMDNCMIQVLNMDVNAIGDDGITTIATALTNSRLRKLWVTSCSITLTGVRSLATLLSVNQSIGYLWLLGNSITTEGAHLLLQSAVNNEACQVNIRIDDEYKNDSEVQRMMNILENRRMKTQMVTTTTTVNSKWNVL